MHPGHDHSYTSLQQLTDMSIAAILPTACGGPALLSPWASLFASRQISFLPLSIDTLTVEHLKVLRHV